MVTAITPVPFPTSTPQVDGEQESQKLLFVENDRLPAKGYREAASSLGFSSAPGQLQRPYPSYPKVPGASTLVVNVCPDCGHFRGKIKLAAFETVKLLSRAAQTSGEGWAAQIFVIKEKILSG